MTGPITKTDLIDLLRESAQQDAAVAAQLGAMADATTRIVALGEAHGAVAKERLRVEKATLKVASQKAEQKTARLKIILGSTAVTLGVAGVLQIIAGWSGFALDLGSLIR